MQPLSNVTQGQLTTQAQLDKKLDEEIKQTTVCLGGIMDEYNKQFKSIDERLASLENQVTVLKEQMQQDNALRKAETDSTLEFLSSLRNSIAQFKK